MDQSAFKNNLNNLNTTKKLDEDISSSSSSSSKIIMRNSDFIAPNKPTKTIKTYIEVTKNSLNLEFLNNTVPQADNAGFVPLMP